MLSQLACPTKVGVADPHCGFLQNTRFIAFERPAAVKRRGGAGRYLGVVRRRPGDAAVCG